MDQEADIINLINNYPAFTVHKLTSDSNDPGIWYPFNDLMASSASSRRSNLMKAVPRD